MNETFTCNICLEDINDLSTKIVLKCNDKHIFCYKCIFEWYDKIKNNDNSCSCPFCRQNGGFLPLIGEGEEIAGIHKQNEYNNNKYRFIEWLYPDQAAFTGPTGYNGYSGVN